MKKTAVTAAFLSVAGLLMLAPVAMADSLTLYAGPAYGGLNPYQYGNGGEFSMKGADHPLNAGAYAASTQNIGYSGSIETFCIELNEEFSPGSTYYYTISNFVNKNNGLSPIPLTAGAAWLYENFATGALTDYNYANNVAGSRLADAGLMQHAIWWAEGYEGYTGNKFEQDVTAALGGNVGATNTDAGVEVLNLWSNSNDTGYVQDQLYLAQPPEHSLAVPEPGSMLLLGSGLSGLLLYRRKSRKS